MYKLKRVSKLQNVLSYKLYEIHLFVCSSLTKKIGVFDVWFWSTSRIFHWKQASNSFATNDFKSIAQ